MKSALPLVNSINLHSHGLWYSFISTQVTANYHGIQFLQHCSCSFLGSVRSLPCVMTSLSLNLLCIGSVSFSRKIDCFPKASFNHFTAAINDPRY